MQEQRAGWMSPGLRVVAKSIGSFVSFGALAASLPFWLGPLGLALFSAMGRWSEFTFANAALNTVVASFSAGAFVYLFWRLDNDGLSKALEAKWRWGRIFARGWPFLVLFGIHCLVLAYRPEFSALHSALTAAGGVPAGLVTVSSVVLFALWYLPAAALVLFVLGCFCSQVED